MSNTATPTDPVRPATTERASLSPDRAFVVHFYADKGETSIQAGRAEHIQSGHTTHFGSWEDLARFVAETIGRSRR